MFRFLTELKALREQQAATDTWMRAMTLQREADARVIADLGARLMSAFERIGALELAHAEAALKPQSERKAAPDVAPQVAGAIRAMSQGNTRLMTQLERDARLMKRGGMSDEAIAASLLAGDVA